jgi:hypothetical protein
VRGGAGGALFLYADALVCTAGPATTRGSTAEFRGRGSTAECCDPHQVGTDGLFGTAVSECTRSHAKHRARRAPLRRVHGSLCLAAPADCPLLHHTPYSLSGSITHRDHTHCQAHTMLAITMFTRHSRAFTVAAKAMMARS